MAGGPLLPSSIYLGGASGNLSPQFYISGVNTNLASAFEGIAVVASLGADSDAILQFNIPEVIPTGTIKCRLLAMANATSGIAKVTLRDGRTPAGSNIGAATLTAETQVSQTWATADILVENKVTLTGVGSLAANDILTIRMTFNTSGWTLAQQSVWQASIVWE